MIDLFSVKVNGNYDEIGSLPTIQNGTFLCDMDSDCDCNFKYEKGYSYQITNGVPSRIEQSKDYKIQKNLYSTIQNVCEWLNNWFTIRFSDQHPGTTPSHGWSDLSSLCQRFSDGI